MVKRKHPGKNQIITTLNMCSPTTTNNKKKKRWTQYNNKIPNTMNIEEEISQLQESQLENFNRMNQNRNGSSNMYTEDNPVLNGYKPRNGNHVNRSHMLSKPSSFVPGHMANEVNGYERGTPVPFDRGGGRHRTRRYGRNDGN